MNNRYGLYSYGKYIQASPVSESLGLTDDQIGYLPGVFDLIAYNANGTKSAIFGAGSEANNIEQLSFELVETGCGKLDITFRSLPTNAELNYSQRVDIHLFNDPRPWYSGYIITRPIEGTTEDSYKFTGHGFYNLLEKVIIFGSYTNKDVSEIVADIARQAERKVGLEYNAEKIYRADYTVSHIEFDGVTAKEALKQLSDFAVDYVCGVDEYRQLYFKPRNDSINEEARFWVGKHLDGYTPTWDVEKVVNRAWIKGGSVNDQGEQWLTSVESAESQKLYGVREEVWTLPSAYAAVDAYRWGINQIDKYKNPPKSAKVENVKLEYPKPNGDFHVRRLTTQGKAAVTSLNGQLDAYPITKLKYIASAKEGISLNSMELGEQPFPIDKYLAGIERDAKLVAQLQSASTKQLKQGRVDHATE